MTPEYVAKVILDGVLTNKELIMIPSLPCYILFLIRQAVPTRFCDQVQIQLELNGAMDAYKKKL
jgi:hypothetical protein